MKRAIITGIIVLGTFFASGSMHANALSLKLPYAKSQRFIVVQGYDTLPTHIGHDAYALDLSQSECEAYGKPVLAVAAGTAMIVQEQGYNGGYGTELVINHGNDLISRYAHMIPGSILVGINSVVKQGQVVGDVGDSGLVAGLACPDHPGTHLHFAMDIRANDGTLTAYKPEPISGYRDMTAGRWYLSDNEEDQQSVASNVTTTNSSGGQILGAYIAVVTSTPPVMPSSSPTVALSTSLPTPTSPELTQSPTSSIAQKVSIGGVAVVSSVPYPLVAILPEASPSSTFMIVPSSTADDSLSSTLFQQLGNDTSSSPSWYDDNWFDLGNGFNGILQSLTLEGKISEQSFLASHIFLQEFKDPNYTAMVQSFTLSDDAPFTSIMATTTFSGLSISLKPYFYYRLATIQDYQNRSVILAGTASTGTYMWNAFVYGTGRVEYNASFTPYMVMTGTPATSTLPPPPLTTPTNLTTSFDDVSMQVSLTWNTSTDPEWPANTLHYEFKYSTSSVLSDNGWGATMPIPVIPGNSYLIGIRAADDFGDVSAIATTTWNFPPGFEKYYMTPGLSYATQDFTVQTSTTLNAIEIFTTNLQTSARYPESVNCSLSLTDLYGKTISSTILSDNGFNGYHCAGNPVFSFSSSQPVILPGSLYRWTFESDTGNPSTQAWVQFYGTADNNAGGFFSDPSIANARFVITGQSGVIFAN